MTGTDIGASGPHHEVIVIGAGVAGIYQIKRLADLGIDALVLDAAPDASTTSSVAHDWPVSTDPDAAPGSDPTAAEETPGLGIVVAAPVGIQESQPGRVLTLASAQDLPISDEESFSVGNAASR